MVKNKKSPKHKKKSKSKGGGESHEATYSTDNSRDNKIDDIKVADDSNQSAEDDQATGPSPQKLAEGQKIKRTKKSVDTDQAAGHNSDGEDADFNEEFKKVMREIKESVRSYQNFCKNNPSKKSCSQYKNMIEYLADYQKDLHGYLASENPTFAKYFYSYINAAEEDSFSTEKTSNAVVKPEAHEEKRPIKEAKDDSNESSKSLELEKGKTRKKKAIDDDAFVDVKKSLHASQMIKEERIEKDCDKYTDSITCTECSSHNVDYQGKEKKNKDNRPADDIQTSEQGAYCKELAHKTEKLVDVEDAIEDINIFAEDIQASEQVAQSMELTYKNEKHVNIKDANEDNRSADEIHISKQGAYFKELTHKTEKLVDVKDAIVDSNRSAGGIQMSEQSAHCSELACKTENPVDIKYAMEDNNRSTNDIQTLGQGGLCSELIYKTEKLVEIEDVNERNSGSTDDIQTSEQVSQSRELTYNNEKLLGIKDSIEDNNRSAGHFQSLEQGSKCEELTYKKEKPVDIRSADDGQASKQGAKYCEFTYKYGKLVDIKDAIKEDVKEEKYVPEIKHSYKIDKNVVSEQNKCRKSIPQFRHDVEYFWSVQNSMLKEEMKKRGSIETEFMNLRKQRDVNSAKIEPTPAAENEEVKASKKPPAVSNKEVKTSKKPPDHGNEGGRALKNFVGEANEVRILRELADKANKETRTLRELADKANEEAKIAKDLADKANENARKLKYRAHKAKEIARKSKERADKLNEDARIKNLVSESNIIFKRLSRADDTKTGKKSKDNDRSITYIQEDKKEKDGSNKDIPKFFNEEDILKSLCEFKECLNKEKEILQGQVLDSKKEKITPEKLKKPVIRPIIDELRRDLEFTKIQHSKLEETLKRCKGVAAELNLLREQRDLLSTDEETISVIEEPENHEETVTAVEEFKEYEVTVTDVEESKENEDTRVVTELDYNTTQETGTTDEPKEAIILLGKDENIHFEYETNGNKHIIGGDNSFFYASEDKQITTFDFEDGNIQVSFIGSHIFVSTQSSKFEIFIRKPGPVDLTDKATQSQTLQ